MTKYCLILSILLALGTCPAHATDMVEIGAGSMQQQGIAAYQRGDYNAALKFLLARAHVSPEDANVYYYLGNCYVKTNQNDQAAHMYSACVRVSPTSQAGKYALKALESLSTMPKSAAPLPDAKASGNADPAAAEAVKDSLISEAPLDKALNDSVKRIQSQRQTVKRGIDRIWDQLTDELQTMSPRGNPNYAAELERVRREAENKAEDLQTKELRYESRMLAPEKIDVRAVPQKPQEKTDDAKSVLGTLHDYYKAEKPFDPFGTDITPELTSKFMAIRDVFGELSTYQPSARKAAKQVFMQLKRSIENKQDSFDQQIFQIKANLIRDIVLIKSNAGNQYSSNYKQNTPANQLSTSSIPRADTQTNLTQADKDLSEATERTKKRVKELEDGYYRDVDSLIAGAKERLGGMVAQVGQMNAQLQHPSGTVQLVPQGTDTYTRNYINFGERTDTSPSPATVQPMRAQAQAQKLPVKRSVKLNSGSK